MNVSVKKKVFGSRLPAILLIALTGAIIYSNSLRGPFLFDDTRTIVENEKIRVLSNFLGLDSILQNRPFADLTFALNYRFGKLDPFGYHVINLLIHILNGVIVYLLSRAILAQLSETTSFHPSISDPRPQKKKRLISDPEGLLNTKQQIPLIALFTALIFVAHPIQTQAVTYISQRYASLAALFYLLSVLFYLKGRVAQTILVWKGRFEKRMWSNGWKVIMCSIKDAVLGFLLSLYPFRNPGFFEQTDCGKSADSDPAGGILLY